MGFRNNSFATVWEVRSQNEKWTKVRVSISRKNQDSGEYETDFSGWVDFYGTAVASKAAKLKEKDRIKLISVDLTNRYDKQQNATFWNPKCFEFEMADGSGSGSDSAPRQQQRSAAYEGNNAVDDSNLPF